MSLESAENRRFLIPSIDFLPNIGGISAFLGSIAITLSELGHTVVVMHPKPLKERQIDKLKKSGVETVLDDPCNPSVRHGHEYNAALPEIAQRLESVVDSYQITDILVGHVYYYGPAALRLRGRVKVHILTYGTEVASLGPLRGWFSRGDHIAASTYKTLKEADSVFAISKSTRVLIRRFGIWRKVHLISCGIPHDFHQDGLDVDPKESLPDKDGSLPYEEWVFVGRLARSKGAIHAVKALKYASQKTCLTIVGSGPEQERLERIAAACKVEERVTFAGATSDRERDELIRSASVVLVPSVRARGGHIEGFGQIVLEAWNLDTPVVAFKTGGLREVLGGVPGGLARAKTAAALAIAATKICSEPSLRTAHLAEGRRRIEDAYNWGHICRELLRH